MEFQGSLTVRLAMSSFETNKESEGSFMAIAVQESVCNYNLSERATRSRVRGA